MTGSAVRLATETWLLGYLFAYGGTTMLQYPLTIYQEWMQKFFVYVLPMAFINYFPTPGDRFYYSFSHGGVRFVILDTGEDKSDSNKEYSGLVNFQPYLEEETKWLREDSPGSSYSKSIASGRYTSPVHCSH